jgi:hypothetical protein
VTVDAGFPSTATFTSSVKDANPLAGSTPKWSTLSFTTTTPAGTNVKFQVAGSNSDTGPFNFVGPDGTAATFFTTSGADLSQFNGKRYLRYKAILSTSDNNVTPSISSIAICFADVAATSLAAAPAAGPRGGAAALSATLTASGQPLSGKTIDFSLNGNPVGSASTNATGVAALPSASLGNIPNGTYANGVSASFPGDSTDDPSSSTAALTVSGAPALAPDPGSGNFGNQRVGTVSAAKTFTITNSGDAPLHPTSVAITGANQADFNKASDDCTSAAVAAGGSCSIAVTFSPSATGTRDASIHIASDAPPGANDIALTGIGTGVAPNLSVSPRKGKFGKVDVDGGHAKKKFTITNSGTAELHVTTIKLKGAKGNYRAKTRACTGNPIATGASCAFKVTFDPGDPGTHKAKVAIASDGGDATVKLAGSGTG